MVKAQLSAPIDTPEMSERVSGASRAQSSLVAFAKARKSATLNAKRNISRTAASTRKSPGSSGHRDEKAVNHRVGGGRRQSGCRRREQSEKLSLALVPLAPQQLTLLVFAHLLAALLDDTAQGLPPEKRRVHRISESGQGLDALHCSMFLAAATNTASPTQSQLSALQHSRGVRRAIEQRSTARGGDAQRPTSD